MEVKATGLVRYFPLIQFPVRVVGTDSPKTIPNVKCALFWSQEKPFCPTIYSTEMDTVDKIFNVVFYLFFYFFAVSAVK